MFSLSDGKGALSFILHASAGSSKAADRRPRERVGAVDVHGARAADALTAGAPEGERRIDYVLIQISASSTIGAQSSRSTK